MHVASARSSASSGSKVGFPDFRVGPVNDCLESFGGFPSTSIASAIENSFFKR